MDTKDVQAPAFICVSRRSRDQWFQPERCSSQYTTEDFFNKKKNLLVTGLPGVGKTTLIKKLSEALKHVHPAGFYTAEIREGGVRKGFELISLEGKKALLSHQEIKSPYQVGHYKVDIQGFEDFLISISFSNPSTHLIIIDEIGKMECLSAQFKKILNEALDSEKWVIATLALKGSGLIAEVKERGDIKLFEITKKNRDSLFSEILFHAPFPL